MMTAFYKVLDMSLMGSIAILFVLISRVIFRNSPKKIIVFLWLAVIFRLLCPFSIESTLSIIPAYFDEMFSASAPVYAENVTLPNAMESAYKAVGDVLNGGIGTIPIKIYNPNMYTAAAYHNQIWELLLGCLWPFGMAILVLYSFISLRNLHSRVSGALVYKDNIYIANNIDTPFVLGIIRPKIYLPSFLGDNEREYIVLHEQMHIKRLDHILKIVGFVAVTVHWFNPLVWLMWKLLVQDIEMACDEAVLAVHSGDINADYSQSLLNFAVKQNIFIASPLAFGEGNTKKRIKNILSLKNNKKKVTIFTIIILVVVVLVCILHPKEVINSRDVEGVYFEDTKLSENAANALVFTINNNDKGRFYSGFYEGTVSDSDDVVIIKMNDGSRYQLHYWYNSGYSFNPLHPGEDDYCSILTYFDADGYVQKKWKMEYYFDGNYLRWRDTYGLDVPFPFGSSFVPQYKVYENWDSVDFARRFFFGSDMSFSFDRFGETATNFGKFEFIDLTKDNFDRYFSDSVWYDKMSAAQLRRDNQNAMRVVNDGEMYYLLSQNDGILLLLYGYYDAEGEVDPYSDDSLFKWCCALSERRGVTKLTLEQVNEQDSLGVAEITDIAEIDSFLSATLQAETAFYKPKDVSEIEKLYNYLKITMWYGDESETIYLYNIGGDYVLDHTPYATYQIERENSVHMYKIYSKYTD
ncbi:MAG: hypothetical protein IJN37_02450 [Clostridia bacterium]|nr:hypothetical protein [Clostridia bacterium]